MSVDCSVLKIHSPLVFTEMSLCEGINKRKHSMISKRSKYAKVDSDEDEDDDDSSDNERQYLSLKIHNVCTYVHQSSNKLVKSSMLSPLLREHCFTMQ